MSNAEIDVRAILEMSNDEINGMSDTEYHALLNYAHTVSDRQKQSAIYKRLREATASWKARVLKEAQDRGEFPKGYDAIFYHRHDRTPVIKEGFVVVHTDSSDFLEFYVPGYKKLPTLPILAHGKSWHSGWDIPTRWAIDADRNGWVDNAHGHALRRFDGDLVTYFSDSYSTQVAIAKALGRKPRMPEWMRISLEAGWTPPPDFDPTQYEK